MATKIKLMRLGKMRNPYYRIVIADARAKRDGRSIEEIGRYNPKADPSIIEVDSGRAQYWLGVGAQPTEAVAALFRVTGDWQKFKGLPAPPPMLMAAPKSDKHAAFAAAAATAAGLDEAKGGATTPKKKAAPKSPASDAQASAPEGTASDAQASAPTDSAPTDSAAPDTKAPAGTIEDAKAAVQGVDSATAAAAADPDVADAKAEAAGESAG